MNIHVHVDHLVLEGLALEEGQGSQVQAAVEAELTRMLFATPAGSDLLAGGARLSVPAQDILVSGQDTPVTLGRQIGRAVYGGISR